MLTTRLHIRRILTLALACLFTINVSATTMVNSGNLSNSYGFELLDHVLSSADEADIKLASTPLEKLSLERKIRSLQQGKLIDVLMLAATKERLENLMAIEVPIQFGFQGLRILLTTKDKQSQLSQIKSLKELRRKIGVFVNGWADSKVYNSNDMPMILATQKENAYAMLAKRRVDYFPRSAAEVLINYNEYIDKYPNFVVEPELMLYYPFPVYFFINKENTELARVLSNGLSKAKNNGEMKRIFMQHHGDMIKSLGLQDRTIIKLRNTNLSNKLPVAEINDLESVNTLNIFYIN